jgi:hypothetical protein
MAAVTVREEMRRNKGRDPRTAALERLLKPIIEGQIETWMQAHPKGRWGMKGGITKRILGDICSAETLRRIELVVTPGAGGGTSRPVRAGRSKFTTASSPTDTETGAPTVSSA